MNRKKIIDLEIVDDLEESGVSAIALVDQPAIDVNWFAFRQESFIKPSSGESESDFMSRCVPLMIDEGKDQDQAVAMCISMYENMSLDPSALPPYVDEITEDREELNVEELDVLGYQTKYFHMCPGAIQTFYNLMEEPLDEEYAGMIRAAAVIADEVFEMEKRAIETESATVDEVKQAVLLVEDFKDIIHEINKETQMIHNVSYMDGHVEKIYSYLEPQQNFASIEELKVGDEVSWKTADQNPRGRIREIIRDDSKKVPGADFEISGTPEDPGYLIEIYEEEDGKWKPTGKLVGRKADSILKNVSLSAMEPDYDAILERSKNMGFTLQHPGAKGLKFTKASGDRAIDLKFARGYTVYKYEGSISGNSREFCREMVGRDRFYTFSEIVEMNGDNPGFGEDGADDYSIFHYKGGPNCKHRWQKYYVTAEGGIENKGPAPGKAGERPYNMPNRGYMMSKELFASEDEQIIVGPAMIPNIQIIRKDEDTGEIYYVRFSENVIQRISEKFMRELRNKETNIEHDPTKNANSYVMESWIIENEEDKANTKYGFNLPTGTWMIKMRVPDEKVWGMVKAGELRGLSIEGSFMDAAEFEEDKALYERIIKILNEK